MRTNAAPSRFHAVRQSALRIALVLVLALIAGVALLYCRQHDLIYHPHPYLTDVAAGLPIGVARLQFRTSSGTQSAYYLARGSGTKIPERLWLAFGGNGSLALDWLDFLGHDRNLADAFLLIEYPGYGASEGVASINSNRAAADGALRALAEKLADTHEVLKSRLNVLGHSFGGAAGLDFATRHHVQRIVLVAPFTTLREAGAERFGLLSYLLVENYDNRAALNKIANQKPRPRVAIFHASGDEIIPMRMGRELAASQPDMIEFFQIKGGDHLSPLHANADEIVAWMNR